MIKYPNRKSSDADTQQNPKHSWGRRQVVTRICQLSVILISLVTVVLSHNSFAAGRVFVDDFEDGTTKKWAKDDFHNLCQVVASASDGVLGPRNGTKMLRCNSNGTVSWSSPDRYESLTIGSANYTNELFIRVWMRRDSNFDMTAGSTKKVLRIYYWDGKIFHDLFTTIGNDTGAGLGDRGNVTNMGLKTYWGDAPGDNSKSATKWSKVEYYIHQSNGTIKVWHDGILIRNDNGLNFDGVKWNPFYITSNFEEPHDATNYVYFDDVEVFTDTGTGAIGSMSDATIRVLSEDPLLPPPLNLRTNP